MIFLFRQLKQNKKQTLVLFLLWITIILIGCFLPAREVPEVKLPFIDKWVHLIFFAGFSFLALCLFRQPNRINSVLIVVLALILGWTVEFIQGSGWVQGRSYEEMDILADGIGGLIGVLFFWIFQKKEDRNTKKKESKDGSLIK